MTRPAPRPKPHLIAVACLLSLAASVASAASTYQFQVTYPGLVATVPTAVAPQGQGQSLAATLTLPSFSATASGSSSTASAVLTNTGTAPITVTVPGSSSVTGTGFSFSSTTCASTLSNVAGSNTCSVVVQFQPTSVAAYPGSLSVTTSAGVQAAALSASGTAPLVNISWQTAHANAVYSNGNRTVAFSPSAGFTGTNFDFLFGDVSKSTGKWYFEATSTGRQGALILCVGAAGTCANSVGVDYKYADMGPRGTVTLVTKTAGPYNTTLGYAFDADANTMAIYKTGSPCVLLGTATWTGTGNLVTPAIVQTQSYYTTYSDTLANGPTATSCVPAGYSWLAK